MEVNEQNQPVILHMHAMLVQLQGSYQGDPTRRKHLHAVKQSIALLSNLLEHNPRELVLDPDDFVQRSIMLYLDETCWGLILRWMQQYEHGAAAGYAAYI